MKVISIILILLLTGAWGYTSWYWYTCNISGFCDAYVQTEEKQREQKREVSSEINKQEESTGSELKNTSTSSGEIVDSLTAPKLSSKDVLVEPQVTKETQEKENLKQVDITITVGSGSILERENTSIVCNKDFIGPISFGGNNDKEDVKFLEDFLLSQGENIQEDGIYGQEEFDAIKSFQLKYKTEILDPWDIEIPTGYVGKTTIEKIKSLTCQ